MKVNNQSAKSAILLTSNNEAGPSKARLLAIAPIRPGHVVPSGMCPHYHGAWCKTVSWWQATCVLPIHKSQPPTSEAKPARVRSTGRLGLVHSPWETLFRFACHSDPRDMTSFLDLEWVNLLLRTSPGWIGSETCVLNPADRSEILNSNSQRRDFPLKLHYYLML